MNQVQTFLLQASIQILVFSVALLAIAAVVRLVLRRRTNELLAFGMGIVVVLWFAAMLPIPGWLGSVLPDSGNSVAARIANDSTASSSTSLLTGTERQKGSPVAMSTDRPLPNVENNTLATFIGGFVDELARPQSVPERAAGSTELVAAEQFSLVKWLVFGCFAAIALGLIRFLIALAWVFRLKRQALPITDSEANECLDIVKAQFSCGKTVALMQIENSIAPFTVGARRPTIFLPVDWSEWSEHQLLATLAHEMAHVQNGDYLKRLLAQFAVALNFYNPLVHWLSKQLEVEQEMSADDLAANAVGGRQSFLKVLAELALEKEYPKSRLVPMFLPTRKTFFRRIEMLRKEKTSPGRSRLSFVVSALLTLFIGLGAVGLRLPQVASANEGGEAANVAAATGVQEEATLAFVPNDADYFVVIRPAAIYAEWGEILDEAFEGGPAPNGDWKVQFEKTFGAAIDNLDQVTVIGDATDTQAMATTYVVRAKNALEWLAGDGLAERMKERYEALPAESFRGMPIFEVGRDGAANPRDALMGEPTIAVVDQKTFVISFGPDLKVNRARLRASLRVAGGVTGETLDNWKPFAKHAFSFNVASDFIEVVTNEMGTAVDPMSSMVRSVLQEVNSSAGGLRIDDGIAMDLIANCASEAGVTKLKQSASMLQLFAKSFSESDSVAGFDGDDQKGIQKMVGSLSDSMETKSDGNKFVATFGLGSDDAGQVRRLIPMIRATRAAARRTDSMNRSRQIVIAMHNYHDATGSFPPAVLTSSSGKKYSWRVALLPYLEQSELYEAYNFDEEWNSENNKKVTAQVPDLYQHPGNKEYGTPNSCYFVVVGENTPFLEGKKTELQQITDGTSQTICLVEANMGIHWAEPRDIPIDTPDLLSKLGGADGGGFNASLCDGSTMFFDNSMDPKLFKAMLTSNGGEVVDLSKALRK